MVALRAVLAALIAVAWTAVSDGGDRAWAGGPANPSFLLFSGTDLWRYGGFLYGGLLWSPHGLDTGGFTLKMLLDGGKYSYISGASGDSIDGTKLSVAALPGWRFTRDSLTVTLFAGPVIQDYRLTPADPGSHLHGFYVGAETAADIWYQPSAITMASVNGAISSIGPTGYVRAAFGLRTLVPAFIGPEIEQIWCADFEQLELGAQLTGLRINAIEWSLGTGLALTSDQHAGPYVRFGFDERY